MLNFLRSLIQKDLQEAEMRIQGDAFCALNEAEWEPRPLPTARRLRWDIENIQQELETALQLELDLLFPPSMAVKIAELEMALQTALDELEEAEWREERELHLRLLRDGFSGLF